MKYLIGVLLLCALSACDKGVVIEEPMDSPPVLAIPDCLELQVSVTLAILATQVAMRRMILMIGS